MAEDIRQRIAAKAIIVSSGRVLILREADTNPDGTNTGRYDVPGGRLEPGEPFFDALRREVAEETGINELAIKDPVYVGEWTPVINGTETQIIGVFVVCETEQSDIVLSEEHDHHQWVSEPELDSVQMMKSSAEAVRNYFKEV